jgi:hypothetical protein
MSIPWQNIFFIKFDNNKRYLGHKIKEDEQDGHVARVGHNRNTYRNLVRKYKFLAMAGSS